MSLYLWAMLGMAIVVFNLGFACGALWAHKEKR